MTHSKVADLSMPSSTASVEIRPGVRIAYEDHWFGAPWTAPEVVFMLHGIGERSTAWWRWVPHLAGRYRLIRPNMPGFGVSPMPDGYSWEPEALAEDISLLMLQLGVESAHIVGAKYGGSIAMRFAIDHPKQTLSLGVFGSPAKSVYRADHEGRSAAQEMARMGREAWLARTMRSRLGSQVSDVQIHWWTAMQSSGDDRAAVAAATAISKMDLTADLPRIEALTLIATTTRSGLQSVDTARAYQTLIPHSRLLVIDSDSYHIAAADPDLCVAHYREFLDGVGANRPGDSVNPRRENY